MAIAALIVSVLALILSLFCVSMMVAKNWFSSHTIQYVPLDQPDFGGGHGGPPSPLDKNPFRDISEPLSPEEKAYFKEIEKKKKP